MHVLHSCSLGWLSEAREPAGPGLPGELPVEAAGNGCSEHCRSHGICYVGVIPSSQRNPYLLLNSLQKKKKKIIFFYIFVVLFIFFR